MARRKRITRKKLKKQRKVIIASLVCLMLIMTVGYAAFQTNLNISAKGNILEKPSAEFGGIKVQLVTEGDGLYTDEYEDGRFIYRGTNPNNYIEFDDEIYRIVAVEADGRIKIVKNDAVTNTVNFDDNTVNRYDADGYCTNNRGCNVWASKTTLLDANKQPINYMVLDGVNYELPEAEAKANRYLNSTGEYETSGFYYTLSSKSKSLIAESDFAVGGIPLTVTSVDEIIQAEKQYYWNGNIGLLSVSDGLKSVINNSETYFLSLGAWYWTINPVYNNNRGQLWSIYAKGLNVNGYVYYGNDSGVELIPTFYLQSDIKLTGEGTESNPYRIL